MTDSTGTAVKFSRAFYKEQRRRLERARDGLLAKAGVSAIRTAAEARGAPVAEDLERAAADGDQEIAVSRLNGSRETYQAVVAALTRIREGTYGLCENCSNPIPEARLEAVPEARYCMSCQSEIEAMTPSGAGRSRPHARTPAGREQSRV